jgi:hypothetical protein
MRNFPVNNGMVSFEASTKSFKTACSFYQGCQLKKPLRAFYNSFMEKFHKYGSYGIFSLS